MGSVSHFFVSHCSHMLLDGAVSSVSYSGHITAV